MVVGKAGRADTPTDPSPLDMVETIDQPAAEGTLDQAAPALRRRAAENRRIVDAFAAAGLLATTATLEQRDEMAKSAMNSYAAFDTLMRHEAMRHRMKVEEELGPLTVERLGQFLSPTHIEGGYVGAPAHGRGEAQGVERGGGGARADFRTAPLLFDVERAGATIFDSLTRRASIASPTAALAMEGGYSPRVLWREARALFGATERPCVPARA